MANKQCNKTIGENGVENPGIKLVRKVFRPWDKDGAVVAVGNAVADVVDVATTAVFR